MSIGREISRRRELIQMTQAQLAELVGCSRAYLCLIEKGRRVPSVPVLESIAKHLLCSAGELLDSSKEAS